MEICPVRFTKVGVVGDYGTMIRQREWDTALFIFNDNEHQFTQRCLYNGAGNSCVRYLRGKRSAGVPTGDGGGYQVLTPHVKNLIDEAFHLIDDMLKTDNFRKIVYSAAPDGKSLGDGIFKVAQPVKDYITKKIWTLGMPAAVTPASLIEKALPNWRLNTWLDVSKALSNPPYDHRKFFLEIFNTDMTAFKILRELGGETEIPTQGSVEYLAMEMLGKIRDDKLAYVVLEMLCKPSLHDFPHLDFENVWSLASKCVDMQEFTASAASFFA